ncbi:methyl-accepting chemotaxis protein [Fusibacter ferrireducens]|uniref:Methyl-accepting chemotaxis protein n=1 Tax=Fusibacter ferrireducens TaxID=2785058 RepID=A0ABR9ZV68_9FIRM|nr:methyl-accepting chemotaxis protein [Fusibacter ferrireducens]MBF4694340.1 methyl-accepting chemotaxis protein [Fusibacter ferrireducens]
MKKSLMTKLMLSTGLLVLTIIFFISLISFKFSSNAIENEVERNLMTQLHDLVTSLKEDQSNVEGLLKIIGDMPVIKNVNSEKLMPEEERDVNNYLFAFRQSNDYLLENIFIADSKGNVIADSSNGSLSGINVSDRDYFVEAKSGKSVWSDVLISKASNTPIRVYIFPIANKSNRSIGYVAAAVKMDKTIALIHNIKVGELGYAYMIDQKGLLIVHPNPDYTMQKSIADFEIPELNKALPDMIQGNTNRVEYSYDGNSKLNLYTGFDEFSISISAVKEEYLKPIANMQKSIIILGIFMLVVGLIMAYIISRYILKRVNRMKTVMLEASKGDLTVKVEQFKEDGDEIDQISIAFNMMLQSFNAIVTDIVKTSEVLSSSSQQMASSAEEGGKAATDVTVAIQEICQGMEIQANDVNNTIILVDDMKHKLDGTVNETLKMAQEAEVVMKTAENSQRLIYETVDKMTEIRASSEKTIDVINKLNEQSDKINKISDTIAAIADQTNLLALNAAIEAARAGEAGKGFAVVAEEIRKLATDSQSSANGINGLIGEIQNEIKEANNFTKAESEAITSGVQAIDVAGNAFSKILTLIENTQKSIEHVVGHIGETQKLGDSVNQSVENIANVMFKSNTKTQEVSSATEEQTAVSEEIAAASDHLSKMAIDLFEQVSQYKI